MLKKVKHKILGTLLGSRICGYQGNFGFNSWVFSVKKLDNSPTTESSCQQDAVKDKGDYRRVTLGSETPDHQKVSIVCWNCFDVQVYVGSAAFIRQSLSSHAPFETLIHCLLMLHISNQFHGVPDDRFFIPAVLTVIFTMYYSFD